MSESSEKELQDPWAHLSKAERRKLLAKLLEENPEFRKPGDPFLKDLETPKKPETSNSK